MCTIRCWKKFGLWTLLNNIKIEAKGRKKFEFQSVLNIFIEFIFLFPFPFHTFSRLYLIFKCWIGISKEYDTVKDFDKSFLQIILRNISLRILYWCVLLCSINLFKHGRGQKRLDKVRLHLIWHSTVHRTNKALNWRQHDYLTKINR